MSLSLYTIYIIVRVNYEFLTTLSFIMSKKRLTSSHIYIYIIFEMANLEMYYSN